MNTPSHIILHWGIQKYFKRTKDFTIPRSFVWWAIWPDIGLYLCVFLYIPISKYILWNSTEYTFRYMFDTLYFEHPLWIFAYNILHSPTALLLFFIFIKTFQDYLGKYYKILSWFFLWCMLHSLFDIPLHHDDGPRIFYPFSEYVFSSPISYWDSAHYANYVFPVEFWFSILILWYIIFPKLYSKIIWKK